MARSVSELAEQLEGELEATLGEVARLGKLVDELESECEARQSTIDEQDEYIAELEEFVKFVREHFHDAASAFDVRERMEKANGNGVVP